MGRSTSGQGKLQDWRSIASRWVLDDRRGGAEVRWRSISWRVRSIDAPQISAIREDLIEKGWRLCSLQRLNSDGRCNGAGDSKWWLGGSSFHPIPSDLPDGIQGGIRAKAEGNGLGCSTRCQIIHALTPSIWTRHLAGAANLDPVLEFASSPEGQCLKPQGIIARTCKYLCLQAHRRPAIDLAVKLALSMRVATLVTCQPRLLGKRHYRNCRDLSCLYSCPDVTQTLQRPRCVGAMMPKKAVAHGWLQGLRSAQHGTVKELGFLMPHELFHLSVYHSR